MKNMIAVCFAGLLALTNCDLVGSDNTDVKIRVQNSSAYTIENLRINTGGGEYVYEEISPGEVSDYSEYDYSYSYFFVSFSVDTTNFVRQPVDYVGEAKIKSGKYTFDISFESFENRPLYFSGDLKKD